MNKTIPIFYTIDENYAPYFSVAVASLVDHVSDENDYTVNVVYRGLTEDSINKLKTLEKDNVHIRFTDINDKIKPIEDKLNNQAKKTHFPISVYFRIFLPVMFPEYDKGIYIDSDTVLNDDIANFYNIDLEGKLLGGIYDSSIIDTPFTSYLEGVIGVPRHEYINSGVLLMDMKGLREREFEKHFLYLINKYDFEVVAPDQDYINAMLKEEIKHLPLKWNSMPVLGKEGIANPSLIHYNLFLKPWHYRDAQYADLFWSYANKSLFKDRIVEELNSFTDERKENDKKTMEYMFEQAKRIEAKEITFKSVFENGLEKRI